MIISLKLGITNKNIKKSHIDIKFSILLKYNSKIH